MWNNIPLNTKKIILVSISRTIGRGRYNHNRLSQIEEVCPIQDVTCADDTNKVVKVVFSVHSAQVRVIICLV